IFVDGKKYCETSPCYPEPLPVGNHEVKVLADGYEIPPARSVQVEAKKDAQLSFTLTAIAQKPVTGLRIGGTQVGVHLYVDDREIGLLPQDVRDLPPGPHRIRLYGERYAQLETTVTLQKDEVRDLGAQ